MESKIPGWEKVKISEISLNVYAGATPNTKVTKYWENGNIPWMSSGEINNELIKFTNNFITQSGFDSSSTKMIPINSVLMALAGQGKTRGKVAINKIELCTNQSLAAIIPNQRVHYEYLYYFLQYSYPKLREISSGDGGRGGLNLKLIKEYELDLPPIKEQKNIGDLLSTWDEAINKVLINIDNERRKKKSIISKVYRGQIFAHVYNKKYFKRLKSFLSEVSVRSNGAIDNVLSVSNSRGFIPQDEQFDREVASKDRSNYKVVSKGEFAYNPSRVNVGSIDLLTSQESGILSPMYVVFKSNNELYNRYLYHFIKSDLFLKMIPKYTQGSVRDSLSFDGLCSMKLYIPTLKEQLVYAQALDTIDDYIKKLEQLLELYRLQKRGLMQQLLTGKIRVSLN